MIRCGKDSSGITYFAEVVSDSGEVLESGDAWETVDDAIKHYNNVAIALVGRGTVYGGLKVERLDE